MRDLESTAFYGTFDPQANEKYLANDKALLVPSQVKFNRSNDNWLLWKNVAWFCLAWLLLTLGSSVVYFMESTIYDHDGLGVVSLAVSMIASAVGCYITEPVLKKIGCRWTMAINGVGNVIFYLANLYANWYTLVTASIIDGFTTGLGTVAAYAFVAHAANVYASRTGADLDRIQSRVSVLYLVFCNAGVIIGNALSPLIFSFNAVPNARFRPNMTVLNQTRESLMTKCGFENHPTSDLFSVKEFQFEEMLFKPEINYVQLVELMELCLGATVVCIFILVVFVSTDDMDSDSKLSGDKNHNKSFDDEDQDEEDGKAMVPFVFNDYRIFLLIPTALVVVGGSSFWAADFAKCFVACSIGLDSLGYVTMWSGVGGTLSGVVFGWFNTKDFRVIPLVIAPVAQIAVLVFLLFWVPDKDSLLLLCVLTVAWYLGIGVRLALFPALIAVVCPDMLKSAYATLYTMTFVGSTMVFLWSNWLKMDIKIFIMLAMFTVSLIGYVILETTLYRKQRKRFLLPASVPKDKNDNPDRSVANRNSDAPRE